MKKTLRLKARLLFLIPILTFYTICAHCTPKAAIATIPKSGTHLIKDLLTELQIEIPCWHYTRLSDFPDGLPDKTVIVVRDLRDVMVSAVFWCEETAKLAIQGDPRNACFVPYASQFLRKTYDEKLLEIIQLGRNTNIGQRSISKEVMSITQSAIRLILRLLNSPADSIFVVRFEEIIGTEAGGSLEDSQRWELLAKMFEFLGYEILPEHIELAFANIYSKSLTYNPVMKKVGRWEGLFNQDHKKAFLHHWGPLNMALGNSNF